MFIYNREVTLGYRFLKQTMNNFDFICYDNGFLKDYVASYGNLRMSYMAEIFRGVLEVMVGDIYKIIKEEQKEHRITSGNVIFELNPVVTIELNSELCMGHNLSSGSKAETYLKMHAKSSMIVNGHFKVFYGSSIEVFFGGVLTLGSGYINSDCVIACANRIKSETVRL